MTYERADITDPFRLGAHLEDDHDQEPHLTHYMDSEALRQLHAELHVQNIAFTPHFHTLSEEI